MNQKELDRLNARLSEITTKRIRLVVYKMEESGVKTIYDIVEWNKKWFCTPKRGELSAEGKRFIRNYMPRDNEDWSLIELENASE